MPGAEIRFDQAANPIPVGTPGVARDDIWLSQPVVCHSVLSGNTAWQWSFLDVPPGSAAVFSGSTTPAATFTPDIPGTYRIQLVTNSGGLGNILVLVIRVRYSSTGALLFHGLCLPAFGERVNEDNVLIPPITGAQNERGYAPFFEAVLAYVLTLSAGGSVQVTEVDCTNAGAVQPAVSVTAFDGTHATISGLGAKGAATHGYDPVPGSGVYGIGGGLDGTSLIINVNPVQLGTITNITDHGGLWEIETAAPTGLTTGASVTITGVVPNYGENNDWLVTVIDSTHFTLQGSTFAGSYTSGGIVSTGPTTLALSGAGNSASQSTFFAAIHSTWPALTASINLLGELTLTDSTTGLASSIGVRNGSANGVVFLQETTVTGLPGVNVSDQQPSALVLAGFGSSGNDGTFIVTNWIDAGTVQVLNPAGVNGDAGTGAVFIGYTDVTNSALYGIGGTLDGTTLIIAVDGGSLLTLNLAGSGNTANMAALFAAIHATWPALTASLSSTELKLQDSTVGPSSSIAFGAGTANSILGCYSTWFGSFATATFAVSLAYATPSVTESGVVQLTGATLGPTYLCTESVGPFRCFFENATLPGYGAVFSPSSVSLIPPGSAITFDGTTVNYDTQPPVTPTIFLTSTDDISAGSAVQAFQNPFTWTLTGSPTSPATVQVQANAFLGWILNETSQPVSVTNSNNVTLGEVIPPGSAAAVVWDGSQAFTSIVSTQPTVGVRTRSVGYHAQRASMAALGFSYPNSQGADVVWGAQPTPGSGGASPRIQLPYSDGSFSPSVGDVSYTAASPGPPVGSADIAVLGNILYMSGWPAFEASSASILAYSINTGQQLAEFTVNDAATLPNTLVAFKPSTDPTSTIGGPSDFVLYVSNNTVQVIGYSPQGGGGEFVSLTPITGSWLGARAILLLGDDSTNAVGGSQYYATIVVWTDPSNGIIWAADPLNGAVGQTEIYSSGNNPTAICQELDTTNFWFVLTGAATINYATINMREGFGLTLTIMTTLAYPSGVSNVDDMVYDGTYLWFIDRENGAYYQMTRNGQLVTAFNFQPDSGYALTLSPDSRIFFDGEFVYVTGLVQNLYTSAVVKIGPATGLPVEYFGFPATATRGLAFQDGEVFVATGPWKDSTGSVTSGFSGTWAAPVGAIAQFSDPSADWDPNIVGCYVFVSNGEPVNSGLFFVQTWTSSTQIGLVNAAADPTDPVNGSMVWQDYGGTIGIQRIAKKPPGIDYGTLDAIVLFPGAALGGIADWSHGRLGARVVEYGSYTGPNTFNIEVKPAPGTKVLFLDGQGQAADNPLTITPSYGQINGLASYVLQTDHGFVEIEWDGYNWLVVRESNREGFATLLATGGTNSLDIVQSLAAMLYIENGGLGGTFDVVSQRPPASGCQVVVRNSTSFACEFSWSSGSSCNIPANTSAIVTATGGSAFVMLAGT